jgi:hypothetical protein
MSAEEKGRLDKRLEEPARFVDLALGAFQEAMRAYRRSPTSVETISKNVERGAKEYLVRETVAPGKEAFHMAFMEVSGRVRVALEEAGLALMMVNAIRDEAHRLARVAARGDIDEETSEFVRAARRFLGQDP